MLIVTMRVDAPYGAAQGVKEALAMTCERFGDTRVVSVVEQQAQQVSFGGMPEHRKPRTPVRASGVQP